MWVPAREPVAAGHGRFIRPGPAEKTAGGARGSGRGGRGRSRLGAGMNAINRSFTGLKRIRKNFGRIPEVAPMPNLIDVQRSSYEAFLQMNVQPDSRTPTGLQEVFKSVFPIDDFAG